MASSYVRWISAVPTVSTYPSFSVWMTASSQLYVCSFTGCACTICCIVRLYSVAHWYLVSSVKCLFFYKRILLGQCCRQYNLEFMLVMLLGEFPPRFCMSTKGGTREGGWVHPQGAKGVAQSWVILHKRMYKAALPACGTSNLSVYGCVLC